MTGQELHLHDANGEPFDELLSQILDGEFPLGSREELNRALQSDPAARGEYLDRLALHALLHWTMGRGDSGGQSAEAPQSFDDCFEPPRQSENAPSVVQPASAAANRNYFDWRRSPARFCAIVLCITIALWAWFFAAFVPRGVGPRENGPAVATDDNGASPKAGAARLVGERNAIWQGSVLPQPGDAIERDAKLHLTEGLAELELRQGARVLLKGPCTVSVRSVNKVELHRGALAARVPPRASGFEVVTQRVVLRDVGTEFGALVEETGGSEVHVFQGEVELYVLADRKKPLDDDDSAPNRPQSLKSGMAWRLDAPAENGAADALPAGKSIELRPDLFPQFNQPGRSPGDEEEGEAASNTPYARAVLNERPLAYWQFEESSPHNGAIARDRIGAYHGRYRGKVTSSPGAYAVASRGVALHGAECIDVPHIIRPTRAYTYALWFKPAVHLGSGGDANRVDLIWGFIDAGDRRAPLGGNGRRPHITINNRGGGKVLHELGFFVHASDAENPKHPIDIFSKTNDWPADQWRHVAATFDGENYALYIDGKLEAAHADSRENIASTGLRIGGGGAWDAPVGLFKGAIDDVAVYDRALPGEAVARLWRAAQDAEEK